MTDIVKNKEIEEYLEKIIEITKECELNHKADLNINEQIPNYIVFIIKSKVSELKEKGYSINIKDSNNYLRSDSIIHFSKKEDSSKTIEEVIEKTFNEIRNNFPSNLHNVLLYILGELSDNINQHSHYSYASLLIKYNKENKAIEIALIDNGITIPGAFKENKINFKNDADAINMALEGISTKEEKGRGMGLSSSRTLIEKALNGKMLIISRNGIYYTNNTILQLSQRLDGTLLYINFTDPQEDLNIYQYFE